MFSKNAAKCTNVHLYNKDMKKYKMRPKNKNKIKIALLLFEALIQNFIIFLQQRFQVGKQSSLVVWISILMPGLFKLFDQFFLSIFI